MEELKLAIAGVLIAALLAVGVLTSTPVRQQAQAAYQCVTSVNDLPINGEA